ncbi:MAG: hypothetical protein KKA54_00925 [Proteobacteria bacterium]|nr:hypothetical protein [Pseudomonadota bacterium]MBU0964917.1 hypothetical protein [Pseudomonadota bacterium]
MENYETIVRFAEWLALPLAYFVLLILFLFFVVRPFFSYLFNWNRINALKTLQEARNEKEIDRKPDAAWGEQVGAEDDESFDPPSPESRNEQLLMSKLAESDPEKAGSLVKQWLRKDQN